MLSNDKFSNITGNYISRPIGIRRIYYMWPLLSHQVKIQSNLTNVGIMTIILSRLVFAIKS